jgi:hypothetical protein
MKLITKMENPVDLNNEVVINFTLEEYGQLVRLINMGTIYLEEMFERAKRVEPRPKSFPEIEANLKISHNLSGDLKTLVLKRLNLLGLYEE